MHTLEGTGSSDPLPYTSYEFFVSAANSKGAVNSTFFGPVVTAKSGETQESEITREY